MKVLLGVTSSISIYKALEILSLLRKKGIEVKVIMTDNAMKMISKIPFFTLSSNIVLNNQFGEKDYIPHISLSDWADIMLVAPATANIIGKFANGIADDLLSTTFISFNKRVFIAPAMNVKMYDHPVVQGNIDKLKKLSNIEFIEPVYGRLACGYEGKGKLAPPEEIVEKVLKYNDENKILKGKKVLVTAGGTIEDIDPVRYITNRSSGLMGISFAKVAASMGAEVTLIYGNVSFEIPSYINSIKIRSCMDLLDKLKEIIEEYDILIMAAAVADYRVKNISQNKIKKDKGPLILELVQNPDILRELLPLKKDKQIFVGFSLETEDLVNNAKLKLLNKRLDYIVANSPENFEVEIGEVKLINNEGIILEVKGNKEDIAKEVFLRILDKNKKGDFGNGSHTESL